MQDLEALYEGDKLFDARLNKFLPQWDAEPNDRYQLRRKLAFYRNYLGAIIDYFSALLFTSKPKPVAHNAKTKEVDAQPGDYYDEFREDCDGTGTDIDAFFKDRLTDAMVHRCSWFSVEQPVLSEGEAAPTDLATFEKKKLGDCWLRALSFDQVLDWETDGAGNLQMAVVFSESARRAGIGAGRAQITQTWEHYQGDRVDSYEISFPKDKPPVAETEVQLVRTRNHNFGRCPILAVDLPRALWAANRLRTPQLEHFRTSNAQGWSLKNSCFAMMIYNVGDPEEFQKATVGAGKGIVLGLDEKAGWEAPPDGHFDALDTNVSGQKDEIFRLAHQMALGVENNAAAIGRTAESKSEDAQSTRVILLAYARKVKEAIQRAYVLIERVRGQKLDWSVEGLDDFADADLIGLLDQMVKLDGIGKIPSITFWKELYKKLANGMLPDLDQATKGKVEQEIEDGTTDPADDIAAERDAATKLFGASDGTGRPGETPPAPTARPNSDSGRAKGGEKPSSAQA